MRKDTQTIKKELRDSKAIKECACRFGVVGDLNRLKICYLLCHHPELSVSEIAKAAGMTISAASHSLKKLRGAGLVKNRRDFRQVFYRFKDNQFAKLIKESLKI